MKTREDKVFNCFGHIVMVLLSSMALIPIILMFISSLTDNDALIRNGYSFFPEKWSAYAYEWVFNSNSSTILRAYGVSILLTVIGTTCSVLITLCLALGALIGEIINIEELFERFGGWLRVRTGNARDKQFVDGFVTASLTVCIGAMAIVGAIEDGLTGDYSILATKAILDFIIVMVMTCSMGKGCIFSAIPVAALQGGVTALAGLIKPVMTDAALSNLSLIGSILIFCVGVNLVFGKKVRVANLLPAVVLAAAAAFLPVDNYSYFGN